MLAKGVKKYLANPILGILPFAIYMLLRHFMDEPYALGIGMTSSIIGTFGLRKYFNSKIHSLTFYISTVALLVASIVWMVGHNWIENPYTFVLVGEISIVIQLMMFRLGKTFLKARLFQNKTFIDKALLNDFFNTATALQYTLTAHLFIIMAYKQITVGYLYPIVEYILYVAIPLFMIIGLFIYQVFRTRYIIGKLQQEEWLPIVTDSGEVTGRIAKAVSKNMGNKYMHPVVRIALICGKKVYLQERDEKYLLDAGKLDHPFEKYMLFRHEVNQAARNSIKLILGRDVAQEPDFVFKYVFENDMTKRLIFLFTVRIDDESQVKRTQKMTGKFWTVKQIDDEFGDGIFSECFELEYEYLKHMILLEDADNLIAKDLIRKDDMHNTLES